MPGQKDLVAVGEVARRGKRASASEQEFDALLRGHGLWEQAERAAEPARGARRRQPGGLLAGLPQELDGDQVTLTR